MNDNPGLIPLLRLIAITDDVRDGREGVLARAAAAVRGGATSVQLRLKNSTPREIVELAALMVKTLGVPIIVNDRADLALAAGAAGVHVGPDDLSVKAIRKFVPRAFIIGASCGADSELENARLADYVGIGPIAGTSSKADAGPAIGVEEFKRIASLTGRPAVGVGGITPEIARQLFTAGAAGVAIMSGIFSASDPERAASSFRAASGT